LSCTSPPRLTDGGTPNDAGSADGGTGAFTFVALDSRLNNFTSLSMAVSADDHVGVAYFLLGDGGVDAGILLPDGGIEYGQFEPNYGVTYVEWSPEAGAAPAQTLPVWDATCSSGGCVRAGAAVQRLQGIAVAFQANAEPVVGYLGGPNVTASASWTQQNATLNFRGADQLTWTEVSVERPGSVLANATVAGLWPALAVDPDGGLLWFAYRDLHGSLTDVHVAAGMPMDFLDAGEAGATSVSSFCTLFPHSCSAVAVNDGDFQEANESLTLGPDEVPALGALSDAAGADGGVVLFQRSAPGTWVGAWTGLPGHTDTGGPSLAWDPVFGFSATASNLDLSQVAVTQSMTGRLWNAPTPVFAYGSGGWYASVAIDPVQHSPSVAFFFCSQSGGEPIGSPSSCGSAQSPGFEPGVYVAEMATGSWKFQLVDPLGFYMPRLSYLSTGKRVIAYQRADGSLWLAVEQ
jgi:hypothetical protein